MPQVGYANKEYIMPYSMYMYLLEHFYPIPYIVKFPFCSFDIM